VCRCRYAPRSRRTDAWMPAKASVRPGSSTRAEGVSSTARFAAAEQADPEIGFERGDLMTDRRRGYVELVGGFGKAFQTRRRLERAQRAQRRQMPASLHEKSNPKAEKLSFVGRTEFTHFKHCEQFAAPESQRAKS